MDRQEIIRMAADAGITPWVYHQWVKDKFIHIDEGLDGDLACLMQFANLVAAAERDRCCRIVFECCDSDNTAQHTVDKIRGEK